MINKDEAVLVFMDVQGRLSELVDGADLLFAALRRLLAGMNELEVPVIVTEQIPAKLGATRPEFLPYIQSPAIEKSAFSAYGEPSFVEALKATERRHVVLCGIETHVCIYQTTMDLRKAGYGVSVVTDAVSSRDPANKTLALRRMESQGVHLTGVEMLLFELLGDASHPAFKAILKIVK